MEEEALGEQRDNGGGQSPIPLPPKAPITLQRREPHVVPIPRKYDGYCGPPPDWRDIKEEEDLEGEFLGSC